jgi:regulator of protease activity HflC (stomatin/prohibitin superfamily)
MLVISFVITLAIFASVIKWLRWLASRPEPTVAVVQPPNTSALVVLKPNTLKTSDKGEIIGVNNDGGDVVNVITTAVGRHIDKSADDPMDWKLVKGRTLHGILYRIWGLRFIGLWRYLLWCDVRTFRFGRTNDETKYHVMAKSEQTKFRHVDTQHDINMESVETGKVLRMDMRVNLTIEETYPVRVELKRADPYAQLTIAVEASIVEHMGQVDPKAFIGQPTTEQSKNKESLKKELVDRLQGKDLRKRVQDETGLTIVTANLRSFDFDEATRAALEREERAELEAKGKLVEAKNEAAQARERAQGYRDSEITKAQGDKEAAILRAQGQKEAQIALNDAAEDRLKRVLEPAAATALTSEVFRSDREAAAYENNDKITTWVNGGSAVIPVGK